MHRSGLSVREAEKLEIQRLREVDMQVETQRDIKGDAERHPGRDRKTIERVFEYYEY